MVFLRPTAVISVAGDPLPGWTPTISAAGIAAFPIAMGLELNFFFSRGPFDMINGDTVANAVITSSVYAASVSNPDLHIFHLSLIHI